MQILDMTHLRDHMYLRCFEREIGSVRGVCEDDQGISCDREDRRLH